ncbi:cbb3-type cytochrome oxidase assembly protein CcoS [Uliginosibacterium gangwonense]|uniref:cbb3-type cytochrome oxidase assembly protein CcoS n=1 Tax=Uliginosibacterium gangwonense TaxID=392736 RepID=UPI00037373CA|nr:cbb3-type cytochrome oxidase assembly protein CcoS [Uliginosibacterium gangwonense]
MESSLFILIPLSIVLVFAIGAVFWWSVKSGQFDDLDGPAYKVLFDDADPVPLIPGEAHPQPTKKDDLPA